MQRHWYGSLTAALGLMDEGSCGSCTQQELELHSSL